MGRVYTVASAKGGVGKTTTTANLGAALAAAGHTVAVVDADVAMPNLGRMLDVSPDGPSLHDVLAGEADPLDAVYDGPGGVVVVPGTTALDDYVKANPRELGTVVDALVDDYDIVLVDTGAGLSHDTVLPLGLADRVILVSTPSRDALGDTAKTAELAERVGATVAGIVLTRVDPDRVDVDAIVDALDFPHMGLIPEDPTVEDASADAAPVTTTDPNAPAAAAYRALADAVIADAMQESFEPPAIDDAAPSDDSPDSGDAGETSEADDAGDADADVEAEPSSAVDLDSVLSADSEDDGDLDSVLSADSEDDGDLDEVFSLDEEELDEALTDTPETDASDDDLEAELDEELAAAFDPEGTGEPADAEDGGGLASALADAESETSEADSDSEAADEAVDEAADEEDSLVADAVAEAEQDVDSEVKAEAEADEEADGVTFETNPEAETSDETVQPAEIPDAESAADSDSDPGSDADDEGDENDEKQGKKGLFGRFFG